ncbi:MAG: riboflavin synthase [Flavobacteriales bacterium]
MFTGIIESMATIVAIEKDRENTHFTFTCPFTNELKIDQSVAHNGVCLTVIDISEENYTVTAIKETLDRTNLGMLVVGNKVNIERCLKSDGRFDGHIVQGHVDTTALCDEIIEEEGSWKYFFTYTKAEGWITVEKGSVCINGVSLTVVNSSETRFSVCIIPYTYEQTNFKTLKTGDTVNLEFDIIGKYVVKLLGGIK